MRRTVAAVLGVLMLTCAAGAVPINGDAALTLSEDQWLMRQQIRLTENRTDRTPAGRQMRVLALPTVLAYGLTAERSVFLKVPYVRKRMKQADGSWRGASGWANASLWIKNRFQTEDGAGRTRRWSGFGGATLPTGRDAAGDDAGRLPQTLQPSSGATDWFGGVAVTDQSLHREWDVSVSYTRRGSANNFRFGDVFAYDLSWQKRIAPREIPVRGLYTQVNVVLDVNGSVTEWNRDNGAGAADSGGHLVYVSPGLQMAGARTVWEASVQIPAVTNLNGTQIEPDAVYVVSFRTVW